MLKNLAAEIARQRLDESEDGAGCGSPLAASSSASEGGKISMGYTHHWYRPMIIADDVFLAICSDFQITYIRFLSACKSFRGVVRQLSLFP